ncbi:muscle-specific protein 300 kDa-like [Dermacentor silvarum]|uniref:muscle-specific protein 300 kDa-like n=1 Tax=Dermacentor silvarum TaxID=543639 RepID=UPI002101D2EE|nr:muscle-specific protein 300 kDa-like [Dermacentor silvarum]
MLDSVVKGHKEQTQKLQEAVKFLEDAVTQHEELSKHLGNVRDWLSSTQEQAVALSNLGLDQLALYSNLERLKAIEASFGTQDEELKRAEKQLPVVLQSTLPAGHNVVVGELDALKQQWQVVSDMVTRARESLEQLLGRWEEHHVQVEKLQQWMSERDAELQGLLLCDTLEAKRSRLEKLQDTLRDLRAKELEVDSLTERAQQLHGGHSTRRSSRLADLALRYQQLLVALTEAVTKWTQYVTNHQTLDKQVADAQQQIKQANEKLDQCELTEGSLSQLESKLAIIQEVSHNKDALVSLVQSATEQCQTVLGETAPVGHGPLSRTLQSLTEAKLALLQRLSALRATLDHARQLWGGLSTLTKQVLSAVEGIEASLEDAGKLQETLAEKKAHAERSKVLEQRLLQEQAQVDNLKSRAAELAKSHPGNEHSEPAFEAVERFKNACKRAEKLVETTEKAYRSHLDFKNACDDLVSWLRQLREKVPPFTRSLSDRLSLESSISVLEWSLLPRRQRLLRQSLASLFWTIRSLHLRAISQVLFDEISTTKEKLGTTCSQLREFREEYEHMSEWLQLMEDDIKNQRTLLWPTLEEKKKAFETAQGLVEELEKGHETLDRVTLLAQGLLTSHLDTYIRNQLTLVSSRYQVTLNLAKDLLGRARDVYNQHEQYRTALVAAREWMDSMAASLAECSGPTTGKSDVEAQLAKVQGMVRKQDEGHALVHAALTAGEKTLRGTHTSGKAPLNQEMQELQKQWDRLVLKLSDAKVSLETALLQWTDYSSSEQRLLQWIADHDNQLEEVKKKRQSTSVKESVTQRKARLRRANSLVKDVESFEPMVESLAIKAQELQQTSAAPKPEISGKYNNLAGSVKEFLRQQKSVMGHLQEFMDACANLSAWLEQAQEKLNKCAEPSGDRNELRSKHGTLKVLEAEQEEGQKRLQLMLALAETARGFMEDEAEQQHVDQEAGLLVKAVEEFEERMAQVKSALDVGLVKWDEYEEQFRRCQDWLNQYEPQVRSFQQLQPDLESKRVKLEEFQVLLQTVFEWQSEFDTLNLKAQLLLETYSDSSICNQFTQLSARYTSLLSLAKEVLHALEQHYQEHQQQQCMYGEVSELLDSTQERLRELQKPSATLDDAESRLRSLDLLWATLQQGRNKVSYMMELTDKVIETTSAEGIKTIRESADNTSAEFERLLQEVSAVRSMLSEQLSALGELAQELQQFESWLSEARTQLAEAKSGAEQASGAVEKKTRLDKIKAIAADAASKSGTAASLEKRLKETKQLNTPERKKMIADFSELQKEAEELAARLEKEVEALERQRSIHAQAVQWLKEAKLKLQKCSDCNGQPGRRPREGNPAFEAPRKPADRSCSREGRRTVHGGGVPMPEPVRQRTTPGEPSGVAPGLGTARARRRGRSGLSRRVPAVLGALWRAVWYNVPVACRSLKETPSLPWHLLQLMPTT